jgi:hypothetical protein
MSGYSNFQVSRNKEHKGNNIFNKGRNFNKGTDKSEKLMTGIGVWASYYRANPHRFASEYLGITLKIFQVILIYMMNYSNYFMYLASRGQGKTWLTAVYCCIRCILWPETKIVVASGNMKQAREVIEKIDDIKKNSPNLAREISDLSTSANDPKVDFHNGSWIKVVASNDGARSKRANCIIVDEFRMVDLDIINKVLRKFLTAPRQPKFLNNPKYSHLQERNKEIYLSSAWYQFHWSWAKLKAYVKAMTTGKNYFICGLPYQLAVKENLLMKEQVLDEMSEDDFDEIAFGIEMGCLFFGESEKAFYKYEDLEKNRKIYQAVYPKSYYGLIKDASFKYTPKKEGEMRLLCCDIATMEGKENDASAYSMLRLIPNAKGLDRHISYIESMTGGHTVTQAIRIRQLYDDLDCDYLVLDTQSAGTGIFDNLVIPLADKERGIEYEPWSCINDEKMAARCIYSSAPKIIYSIKAGQQLNSDAAIGLRDNLKRGKVRLLISDNEGRENLKNLKGYGSLPLESQAKFENTFIQTTLLVNEMINLEGERNDSGLVKLKEPSGKRKDRYSSVSYGNYIASEIERNMQSDDDVDDDDDLVYY